MARDFLCDHVKLLSCAVYCMVGFGLVKLEDTSATGSIASRACRFSMLCSSARGIFHPFQHTDDVHYSIKSLDGSPGAV